MFLLKEMITCLLITIVVEISIVVLLKYRKKDLLLVFLVNTFTNPLVVSINYLCGILYHIKGYYISLIILEIFAFISEGFIYKRTLNRKKINPYLLSLILNISSYVVGYIFNSLITF